MEWKIRLEARTGWGEVTTCEIGTLRRGLGDLTADGIGLALAEAKSLLAELQQQIVQSQVDEYITCARVCSDCMKLRPLRDRKRQGPHIGADQVLSTPRTHSTGHFLSYKSRRAWIYTSRSYGYSRSRNLVDGDRVHCALVVELTIRNLALSKLNDHVIGHLCR